MEPHRKQKRDQDRDTTGDRREDERGQSVQAPSLIRMTLLSGVISLIFGVVGAWGYWHFLGSAKADDQKSSSKNANASENSDSSKTGSGKNDKLHQAEAAWKAAVTQLHEAQSAEKVARHSEEETKEVLEFFKKNLLSAGRPVGDVSLSEAFWSGGRGKDLTLREAVDTAESRVARTFADRPLGEASAREMLGLAYWSVGDAARAAKQYERALALREAMGANGPDTADCRNQLAVVYRLAGRTDEASRLFDRNPYSPDRASAMAVLGSTLLFQKKPAEAELKLRECLTIRQKIQPDDWTTFDTKSVLGEALLDQKKYAEAEPLLLSGFEGMKRREDMIPSRDKSRLTKSLERLAKLYEAWGKEDKATKWRTQWELAAATTRF